MHKYLIVCALAMSFAMFAADEKIPNIPSKPAVNSELSRLDDLIAATQKGLDQQKALRDVLVKYQEAQKTYLSSGEDTEYLYQMIVLAHRAQKIIQDNHLSQVFSQDFLNELNLFAQMANKRGIPKP